MKSQENKDVSARFSDDLSVRVIRPPSHEERQALKDRIDRLQSQERRESATYALSFDDVETVEVILAEETI